MPLTCPTLRVSSNIFLRVYVHADLPGFLVIESSGETLIRRHAPLHYICILCCRGDPHVRHGVSPQHRDWRLRQLYRQHPRASWHVGQAPHQILPCAANVYLQHVIACIFIIFISTSTYLITTRMWCSTWWTPRRTRGGLHGIYVCDVTDALDVVNCLTHCASGCVSTRAS